MGVRRVVFGARGPCDGFGCRGGWVCRLDSCGSVEVRIPELYDLDGRSEDARLYDLYLHGTASVASIAFFGTILIHFLQRFGKLAADGGPFYGFEIVVLEDYCQGRRA